MDSLEFNMKFKDYELRSCTSHLCIDDPDEPNTTIDFVRHKVSQSGNPYCYSIGYFYRDRDGCWELKFVGGRFREIPKEDVPFVWEMLKAAFDCLTAWANASGNEPDSMEWDVL